MIVGYNYSNEWNDGPKNLLDCEGYFREVPGETHKATAERFGLPNIGFMNFQVFDQYDVEIFLEAADKICNLLK